MSFLMENQQPRPKGKVQRLSRKRVGSKRLAIEVVSIRKDEDIVCALVKIRGVLYILNTGVAT